MNARSFLATSLSLPGCATLAAAGAVLVCTSSLLGAPAEPSEADRVFQLPASARIGPAGTPSSFSLWLPIGGVERLIQLEPVSLRTEEFRVFVTGPRGEFHEIQPPLPRTLRGVVHGSPSARVFGSLLDDGLHLLIQGVDDDLDGDDRDVLVVQPVGAGGEHRLFPAVNELPEGFCGVTGDEHLPLDLGDFEVPRGSGGDWGGGVAGTSCQRLIEMAFDADFQFYQSNGSSVPNTIADMENVFAGVQTIYGDQLDVPFLIGTIVVRTTTGLPYDTNNPSDLLGKVAAEWSTNLAGVPRDLVHLFTGKNLSGSTIGIAYTPGACVGAGYSLSQSKWSLIYNNRVSVCAHELGHNLGGQHCNGQPDCGIMCAAVNGCPGGILNFGVFETNQILGYIDAASCLGPIQPSQVASSGGTLCTAVEISFVPAEGATSHTIWRAPGGAGQGSAVAIAFDAVSPYLDSSVPAGPTFQYWVSAVHPDGCESKLTGPVSGFIPSQLSSPSSVIAADAQSCVSVGVLWSGVTGNNGYQVWRSEDNDPANAIFLDDDNSSPYFDASAQPGVVYRYWVRTKNACGAPGPFGNSDLGSRKAAPSPGAPSASDGVSCDNIQVSWAAVPGATSYTIWRGPSSDPSAAAVLAANVVSPYVDFTVTPGATLWYFVQAGNECGAGGLGVGDSGTAGIFGDLTGDCLVNGADLGALLSQWGTAGSADLNGDGIVNGADLGLLTAAWTG